LTMVESVISQNTAGKGGWAEQSNYSACSDVGVGGNGGSGGGISAGQLSMFRSAVSANGAGSGGNMSCNSHHDPCPQVVGPAGGSGGGIMVDQLEIVDSNITGNSAGPGGWGSLAGGDGGGGGGIVGSSGSVVGSAIHGNAVGDGGWGWNGPTGAPGAGGGIRSGSLALTNVTISGNNGGGVSATSGQVTFSTIANNTVCGATGGATFRDTIIAGNAPELGGVDCTGTLVSAGYNLIGATTGCTITGDPTGNLLDMDPLLGPLADNGGPTWTHALLAGSAALDAGVCTDIEGKLITNDQRGLPRPGGATCDIGAYESQLQSLHRLCLPVITRS